MQTAETSQRIIEALHTAEGLLEPWSQRVVKAAQEAQGTTYFDWNEMRTKAVHEPAAARAEVVPVGSHPVFILTKADETGGLEVRGCSGAAMKASTRVRPTARWVATRADGVPSTHALTIAAFTVLNSGQPRLGFSPNGAGGGTFDLFPLLERSGVCYGVLVSGSRTPNELSRTRTSRVGRRSCPPRSRAAARAGAQACSTSSPPS